MNGSSIAVFVLKRAFQTEPKITNVKISLPTDNNLQLRLILFAPKNQSHCHGGIITPCLSGK
jgi:hypothetical protein